MAGKRNAIMTLLITTALVIGFAGLNVSRDVSGSLPPAAPTHLPNGLSRVVVSVDGLSCVACEIPVRHALRRIDGVKAIYVSAAIFFFQAEDGIRDLTVTGVQTCALPI